MGDKKVLGISRTCEDCKWWERVAGSPGCEDHFQGTCIRQRVLDGGHLEHRDTTAAAYGLSRTGAGVMTTPDHGCSMWEVRQLTREEALAFEDVWESLGRGWAVRFQLGQELLCMPFQAFHEMLEDELQRPVQLFELSDAGSKRLLRELDTGECGSDPSGILTHPSVVGKPLAAVVLHEAAARDDDDSDG